MKDVKFERSALSVSEMSILFHILLSPFTNPKFLSSEQIPSVFRNFSSISTSIL